VCPKASKASLICRTEPRLNFIRNVSTPAIVKYPWSRARLINDLTNNALRLKAATPRTKSLVRLWQGTTN